MIKVGFPSNWRNSTRNSDVNPYFKFKSPFPKKHWGRAGDGVEMRHFRIFITFFELHRCTSAYDARTLPVGCSANHAITREIVHNECRPFTTLVDKPDMQKRKYTNRLMGCEHEAAQIEFENGAKLVDCAVSCDPVAQRFRAMTRWECPDGKNRSPTITFRSN